MAQAQTAMIRSRFSGLLSGGRGERLRTLYFIALAVLAALVPLIVFAGMWTRSEWSKSEAEAAETLLGRAAILSERIDTEISQQLSVLNAIATMPSLDDSDMATFHAAASRMLNAMPQWTNISVLDAISGRQIINTLRPVGSELPVTTAPEVVRRVVETGRPAIHTRQARHGIVNQNHVVLLFVPVVRDGAVRYVLAAGMRADLIQDLMMRSLRDSRFLIVLLDEREMILARSRTPERYVGEQANEQLRNRISGRSSGLFTAETLDGQVVLTTFQRSPLTGWVAVAATDRQQFDSLSERSTLTVIGTGAVALALAGVLAIVLFYNVIQRRVTDERLAASQALNELDARLLATTQEALAEQRKASAEREVLLREIYHRVKNNLQIIQSLLRLGARDLAPEQREPFENAIRRVGAMARVHTLLYNSPDLASIDFKDYLDGLVRETADAFGAEERSIRTVVDAPSMRVSLDIAVPLAFIAVEFLTNAFKHAFPEGQVGTIRVTTRREGDLGCLSVEDDGVGLPEDALGRRSLGLTIVNKLVQQIDGTLDQPEQGGSLFRVRFPLGDVEEPEAEAAAAPST